MDYDYDTFIDDDEAGDYHQNSYTKKVILIIVYI